MLNNGGSKLTRCNYECKASKYRNCTMPASCAARNSALFAQKSSLRGLGKIQQYTHSKKTFLSLLWSIFVLAMAILLAYGVINLIEEFLDYQITIQTQKKQNDKTPFPSMTFCSHRPFSEAAYHLWRNHSVLSPRKFSQELRTIMKHSLDEGDFLTAENIFYNDKMSTYYQNIKPSDADRISHEASQVLIYCILKYGNITSVGHIDDCGVDVKKVSHPNYINCHTVTARPSITEEVTTAAFVLVMGRGEPDYNDLEQGFVQNMLGQNHGVRITLHENGTMPLIEQNGISVPPSAFSEVKYKVIKQERVDCPRERCFNDDETAKRRVHDAVSGAFSYSPEACISDQTGKFIMEKCNCVSAFHLRRTMPKEPNISYCQQVHLDNPDILINNIKCLRQPELDVDKIRQQLVEETCLEPCKSQVYDTAVSTSKWLPTVWQMHWSKIVSDAWRVFRDKSSSKEKVTEARYNVELFVNSTNLTDMSGYCGKPQIMHFGNGDYLFVSVVRTSFTTIKQEEKLKITVSVLISRVGGLGSLTLGLTCAFVVELVEFFYLCQDEERERNRRLKEAKEQSPEEVCLNNNAGLDEIA